MVQQHLNNGVVEAEHRHQQDWHDLAVPRRLDLGIRTVFKQCRGSFEPIRQHSPPQRRLRRAVRSIDTCTMGKQTLHGLDPALPRSQRKRRATDRIPALPLLRPQLQQQRNEMRGVVITRRPEKRREAAEVIRDVDIGISLFEQHADRLAATSPHSLDKRRATAAQRIHISAVAKQRPHSINLATRRRQTERTITLRRRGVDISTMAKQKLQSRGMSPIRSHHDRRAMAAPFPPRIAVSALRRDTMHVGAVRDQIYHDIDMSAGSGVQQRRGGRSALRETVAQFMAQATQHD